MMVRVVPVTRSHWVENQSQTSRVTVDEQVVEGLCGAVAVWAGGVGVSTSVVADRHSAVQNFPKKIGHFFIEAAVPDRLDDAAPGGRSAGGEGPSLKGGRCCSCSLESAS